MRDTPVFDGEDGERPVRRSPGHRRRRRGGPWPLDLLRPALPRALPGALALAGAQILTVPANFTERTGRDHWEVLLRARAIENGAWVLAPAQIGGPPGQPAFGRSMVVDPWGTVIAQAPDRVGIVRADVDLEQVARVRRQIPALAVRPLGTYPVEAGKAPGIPIESIGPQRA